MSSVVSYSTGPQCVSYSGPVVCAEGNTLVPVVGTVWRYVCVPNPHPVPSLP